MMVSSNRIISRNIMQQSGFISCSASTPTVLSLLHDAIHIYGISHDNSFYVFMLMIVIFVLVLSWYMFIVIQWTA